MYVEVNSTHSRCLCKLETLCTLGSVSEWIRTCTGSKCTRFLKFISNLVVVVMLSTSLMMRGRSVYII